MVVYPGRTQFLRGIRLFQLAAIFEALKRKIERIPSFSPILPVTKKIDRELTGWTMLRVRTSLVASLALGALLSESQGVMAQFYWPDYADPPVRARPAERQRGYYNDPSQDYYEPSRRRGGLVPDDYRSRGYESGEPTTPRGARTQSRARVAALPPDADPNYSTPVDFDPDVDPNGTARIISDLTAETPNTITIDTRRRKLYLSLGNGRAIEYGIGVGRQGFTWKGTAAIGRKAFWPGWTPPPEMLARRPDLPKHMDGGLDNPLGARALYLFMGSKDTLFRIHGTNEPETIGRAVSSGCIRMLNADVIDLYRRVTKGTRVVVL
jgi:lipoprotein-anchoring transpeptidase ErfK/SrfK